MSKQPMKRLWNKAKEPKNRKRIGIGAVAAVGIGWALERFAGISLPGEAIGAISGVLEGIFAGL